MPRVCMSKIAVVLLTLALAAGCGPAGGAGGNGHVSAGQAVQPLDDGGVKIHITSDDQMRFNIDEFTVRTGQNVRLRLDHIGTMSAHSMGHNVVIVETGEDPVQMGVEIQREGGSMDNDYVPDAVKDRVIAFTRMLGGGESDTVEFTAPAPGEYPFFCSFPGHFGVMRGVMTVTE